MAIKRKIKKVFLVFFILLLITGSAFIYLVLTAAKPPVESINECHDAISRAKQVEAEKYAPVLLTQSQSLYQSAMREWQYQNERWFITRDFSIVLSLTTQAREKAKEAESKSMETKGALHTDISTTLAALGKKVRNYEKNYSQLPLEKSVRKNFNSGKLIYLECKGAYDRGEYNGIGEKLIRAYALISQSVKKSPGHLEDYFRNFSNWKKWAGETIEWSSSNGAAAIIVDKFARKCYVYTGGKLKKEFNIELGPNWMGTKLYKGDKATPEGRYYITRKKSHRQTKYYKAMLIDYPNEEDERRYTENVRKGLIPRRGTGNLIEIHGEGGKGLDWTEGCVAMTNEDIDVLYNLSSVGTPVTIVGSLKPLNQVNGF